MTDINVEDLRNEHGLLATGSWEQALDKINEKKRNIPIWYAVPILKKEIDKKIANIIEQVNADCIPNKIG